MEPDSREIETPRSLTLTADIGDVLAKAIEHGISPEGLEKLVGLQERIMAKQAEMEFNGAVQAFQSTCPKIEHNKTADAGGKYSYTYTTLDHLIQTIKPHLQAHGLSISFDSRIAEGMVEAVCHVRHVQGHSSSATFSAPVDATAKMNNMQKQASALSYARRYALQLALGLSTAEEDDDGVRGGTQTITEEQLADLQSLLQEFPEEVQKRFLSKVGGGDLSQLPAKSYKRAVNWLESMRG